MKSRRSGSKSTPEEARFVVENFEKAHGSWNVDYAVAYDEHGKVVVNGCPYG